MGRFISTSAILFVVIGLFAFSTKDEYLDLSSETKNRTVEFCCSMDSWEECNHDSKMFDGEDAHSDCIAYRKHHINSRHGGERPKVCTCIYR